jgi:predicted nucleic acid-binding protein
VTAPLVTCEAVISESCYLLRDLTGAAQAIVENVTSGVFQIPFQLSRSAPAIGKIFRKYRGRDVDFADACLIHMAAELRSGAILTLDRDFRVYRWARNRPFELLVPLS